MTFRYGQGEPQALDERQYCGGARTDCWLSLGRPVPGKRRARICSCASGIPTMDASAWMVPPARHSKLDDLRRRIALVSQDTYLFNTVAAAPTTCRRASPMRQTKTVIARGAQSQRSRLHRRAAGWSMTRRLANGGAQPLRVASANVSPLRERFLKDAQLLILDEATSHLDAVNEREVRDALARLTVGRTTVVIAHRLSTIRDADKIVVLDHGTVVEQGIHADLLRQNGMYAALVARQIVSSEEHAGSVPRASRGLRSASLLTVTDTATSYTGVAARSRTPNCGASPRLPP